MWEDIAKHLGELVENGIVNKRVEKVKVCENDAVLEKKLESVSVEVEVLRARELSWKSMAINQRECIQRTNDAIKKAQLRISQLESKDQCRDFAKGHCIRLS